MNLVELFCHVDDFCQAFPFCASCFLLTYILPIVPITGY